MFEFSVLKLAVLVLIKQQIIYKTSNKVFEPEDSDQTALAQVDFSLLGTYGSVIFSMGLS